MTRPLIIGIGNTLRSDDGAGAAVCARVQEALGDAVEVQIVHQLTPELCAPISQAREVIFVDAHAESAAGTLGIVSVQPLAADGLSAFTHDFTPAALLAAARELFGQAPPALMVTIGAQSFELGETLSPKVAEAVSHAAYWVIEQVNDTWGRDND
jgi:hydrogenase maturation protease